VEALCAEPHGRSLDWSGCSNVRDLGGLRTTRGRELRRGALVRADSLDQLTDTGWNALREHGVRTIVDLRAPAESGPIGAPPELTLLHLPVSDFADEEFWSTWRGVPKTSAYYRGMIERWPARYAAAVSAVARAEQGGVVVTCQMGRDRTGLVVALLLRLVHVPIGTIAADWEYSTVALSSIYDRWIADAADDPEDQAVLIRESVVEARALREALHGLDVRAHLQQAGLPPEDVAAVERRLLVPREGDGR
jgi:protein-tyrosine phosphatase